LTFEIFFLSAYYQNWGKWESDYWNTKPGTKDEREVLYKMKKWQGKYFKFFKDQIREHDQKTERAKKGNISHKSLFLFFVTERAKKGNISRKSFFSFFLSLSVPRKATFLKSPLYGDLI
jgi:hypothetical protein